MTWDHPDAVTLREAMTAEVAALYADSAERAAATRDGSMGVDPASIVVTVLLCESEEPVAHVALRRLGVELEIKRMYVVPRLRGQGLSRRLLDEMEQAARDNGAQRVILHTGTQQIAAIALYERHGYTAIPLYPPYVRLPDSLCFEKVLVEHVTTG